MEQNKPTTKQLKTHNDYLLSVGHEFYCRARSADRMHKCLYWLDRYYDANSKLVNQVAKQQKTRERQNAQLKQTLRDKPKKER